MKKLFTLLALTALAILPMGPGWSQTCSINTTLQGHFETLSGELGGIKVVVDGGGFIKEVEVNSPCAEPYRFDLDGVAPVRINAGLPQVITDMGQFSLSLTIFGCDGQGGLIAEINLGDLCDDAETGGQPITVNPGAPPAPTGDDDDDDDGNGGPPGGTTGTGERQNGRVAITNAKPIAELIGIEVEVNPTTIDLRRVASGVADVSFTARLVWSNDNLPQDFEHDPANWNFLSRQEGGEWDPWEPDSDWGASMWDHFRMEVEESPEKHDAGVNRPMSWKFRIDRSNLDTLRSKQLPVRAVYRKTAGDADSEIDTVVNVRVENQTVINPLATSSGPAARTVTYRRILE